MSHTKRWSCIKPDGDGCDGDHTPEPMFHDLSDPKISDDRIVKLAMNNIIGKNEERLFNFHQRYNPEKVKSMMDEINRLQKELEKTYREIRESDISDFEDDLNE